jgi:soluble lytic murein transglycosylase-like protein
MKSTVVMPIVMLAFILLVASARDDASPKLLPAVADLPFCLPGRALGPDGGRRYDSIIVRHARKRGLNPRLVKAIIAAESQFVPTAVSRCGARGLMQVMPATAADVAGKTCNLSDPETNIAVGTEYLARLFKTAGRGGSREAGARSRVVRRVIAAYHSGPGVMNARAWSPTTRLYVRTVLNCYESPVSVVRVPEKPRAGVASRIKKKRGRVL